MCVCVCVCVGGGGGGLRFNRPKAKKCITEDEIIFQKQISIYVHRMEGLLYIYIYIYTRCVSKKILLTNMAIQKDDIISIIII